MRNIAETENAKILRKTDIVLIAGFLIFAAVFYFIFDLNSQTGDTAIIKLNGKFYAEISLNEDRDIDVYLDDGTLINTVRIRDRKAFMIYANCPDKLCMRQSNDYLIVCLPNRVTVEIKTKDKSKEFDIIIDLPENCRPELAKGLYVKILRCAQNDKHAQNDSQRLPDRSNLENNL